jgi:NADPH-dependent curcumin reductase CurA
LTQWIKEGKIKLGDHSETVVDTKFDDIPKTWHKLFEGGNRGKLITKLV